MRGRKPLSDNTAENTTHINCGYVTRTDHQEIHIHTTIPKVQGFFRDVEYQGAMNPKIQQVESKLDRSYNRAHCYKNCKSKRSYVHRYGQFLSHINSTQYFKNPYLENLVRNLCIDQGNYTTTLLLISVTYVLVITV